MLKSALRKYYLEARKQFSDEKIAADSMAISKIFFQEIDLTSIKTIHVFLPITTQREIDTFLIINELKSKFPQINVAIPRSNPETFEMESYLFTSNTILEKNQWNILEPKSESSQIVQPTEIDSVLIPLLVFDKSGNRVGYGKGFYDRFLSYTRPDTLKIGLSVFPPIEAISDISEFDIPLDMCICPKDEASNEFELYRMFQKFR
jgi:5-formyltetrahydrofolate cyclo-ligase